MHPRVTNTGNLDSTKVKNSYFSYRFVENTGPGAEFGNFALAKLANERRAGVLNKTVGDRTFSYRFRF